MKMLWYGGPSYSYSTDHAEDVPSIRAALRICRDRMDNRDGTTPCVSYGGDHDVAADLFSGEDIGDGYPDRRVYVGPRGGFRVERC